MAPPVIVVLGGYGNTGRACARLLLGHSPANVVVAGRDGERAAVFAAELNASHAGERATWIAADATRRESLSRAFEGATMVVAASSTTAHASAVAEAALEAGADYIDPQYSKAKLAALRRLAPKIEAAGLCFVTDGGFHPGLPAALIRFAAGRVEHLRRARVASVIQIDWTALELSPATIQELVTEFMDYQSLHYRDRAWRSMGWVESLRPIWVEFGHGYGRRYTMPMFLEELRPLPEMIPSLEETGFFVGGFNPVVDFVLLPVGMAWMAVAGRRGAAAFGRLLLWGLKRFTPPPYGTLLQLEAEGIRAGQAHRIVVEVAHPDGYVITAAPMAACVLQMLDGSARRPGLHLQALLVEPRRFLDDMRTMGVEVVVRDPA